MDLRPSTKNRQKTF